VPEALQHVDVIAREIRRLDDGARLLKFNRPEDLKLPVSLADLINEVVPILTSSRAAASTSSWRPRAGSERDPRSAPGALEPGSECLPGHAGRALSPGWCDRAWPARITVSDTGIGIKPEHLQRIFDL
jgi:hypothetical protein